MEVALKTVQRKMIFSDDENHRENDNNSDSLDKYIVAINILKSVVMISFGGFAFYNAEKFVFTFYSNDVDSVFYYIFEGIVLLVTFYIIAVFGGFLPKKIALKYSKSFARFGMIPIKLIYYVFIVFFIPFVKLSSFLNRQFGIDKRVRDDDITQEEIMMMIEAGGEKGAIDYDEKEMIANVFEFDDKTAGDIVTHRKDIIAVSMDSSTEDIINVVLEEKYSRIPVYDKSIDNIVGILHIKDVMKHLIMFGKDNFDIKSFLMEPFFVPFTKKNDELFKEMQESKIHLCIVLDEYGGTLGIVSMEDLIEEVMGNILDEYDDEEAPDIISNDGVNFYIDGKANYKDVCKYLKIDIDDEEEYDTMSGFFIGKMGHIPEIGEDFHFETEDFLFTAEKVEENRISLIKAIRKEKVLSEEVSA